MHIIKAQSENFDAIKRITHETISEIYPRYYAKGVVNFFLAHHSNENIMKDILKGIVYLMWDEEDAIGTVTIKENEICRLFVLPKYQHKGFGRQLLDFAEKMIAEEYREIYLDSSLPAKNIYLKRGYVAVETHKIVAENGDVLCYDLMKKNSSYKNRQFNYLIDKYGMVNITIAAICVICLVVNSIIVSETALNQLASNKYLAYIINFLAGCEGKLGTLGSMSNAKVFSEGEWWRLFLHMYLHAGVLHMLFNVFALLFMGKVVEKKIGSLPYLLLYHVIAVVNAIIMCLIFPDSVSVGASAGIFGMIGIVCVMKWKKDAICNENLKKGELIYVIIFSVLSLLLGLESFVTHFVAFIFGTTVGLLLQKKPKCE